jgi:hypothetical protein
MSRRLLPLSFVAGLLGALAFAVPASASTDQGACVINGTATTNPPVLLSGGSGSFSFASGQGTTPLHLICAGANTTTDEVGVADVNSNSAGNYTNTVCGTGSATSNVGQNSLAAPVSVIFDTSATPHLGTDLTNAIPGVAYGISFAGGQGTFKWGSASSIKSLNAALPADGAISIGANFDANQQAGQCTTHFTVTGAITGQFPGS